MKKEFKQTLKVIILGLILGFGISLVSANQYGTYGGSGASGVSGGSGLSLSDISDGGGSGVNPGENSSTCTGSPSMLNVGPSTQIVDSNLNTLASKQFGVDCTDITDLNTCQSVLTYDGIATSNLVTIGNVGISSLIGNGERKVCSNSSGKLVICTN